jgi:hypothetical protein|nr:MAG TPA: replisome organizer [Caudoviricetes sp.]
MNICYVKAYFDWIEQTAALSDAERGRLFIAILEYARSGLEPKLDGREGILFPVFRTTIDRDNKKSASYSENGKKGGRGNKANESDLKQNKANESKMPNIRHKTQDKDKDKDKDNSASPFESFWAAYPRKVGKQAAKKAFSKVSVPVKTLIDAVNSQKNSEQWRKDNGQYIPNPATWLNQGRWDDVLTGAGAQQTKEEYHVGTWL